MPIDKKRRLEIVTRILGERLYADKEELDNIPNLSYEQLIDLHLQYTEDEEGNEMFRDVWTVLMQRERLNRENKAQ